jgi:gas vesicle protein
MSDNRSDLGGVLGAFLAGALIGVGVGMLLAPKPGRETRRQLADLAKKAQHKAEEMAGRIRRGEAAAPRADERVA